MKSNILYKLVNLLIYILIIILSILIIYSCYTIYKTNFIDNSRPKNSFQVQIKIEENLN